MTLRCRKGDMAIVLKGAWSGKIVDVVEFVGVMPGNVTGQIYKDIWKIRYQGSCYSDSGAMRGFPDEYLLPIRPGDLDESEETERVMEFSEG